MFPGRNGVPPHPPRWVWRKLPIFNALETGFYRKYFVLEEPGSQTAENRELVRRLARSLPGIARGTLGAWWAF